MSKPEKITLDQPVTIEKLVPGGQGLATLPDGKKAFFWNALPGEEILEFTITKKKPKYIEAIATKIASPSPHRIPPKDPCYLSTSPWQIMDYDYELAMKRELLLESFCQNGIFFNSDDGQRQSLSVAHCAGYGRAIGVEPRDDGRENPGDTDKRLPLPITDDNDYCYRNKMEYSLFYDHSDEKIHLAFHQRGSHQKIPIAKSSLERPEIFARAQEIVADLNARGEEARKYQSLLLRCNQKGEVSGGLYENGKPHPVFDNLTDEILGHEYSYSPNGFFQINLPVYEMALKEIKKHITTENVLDLYSGVGTIGLSVARDKNLTLVEVDKSAYRELEKNCRKLKRTSSGGRSERSYEKNNKKLLEKNDRRVGQPSVAGVCGGYDRAQARETRDDGLERRDPAIERLSNSPKAILSKSEEVLDFIKPDQTVILDPPRAGIDKKLTSRLLKVLPETIIYLSCNPSTQARDLRLLTETKKYEIIKIQPYNFFPRTPHLENLVVLHRV